MSSNSDNDKGVYLFFALMGALLFVAAIAGTIWGLGYGHLGWGLISAGAAVFFGFWTMSASNLYDSAAAPPGDFY